MAWVAVDKNGEEFIYEEKPDRGSNAWSIWLVPITGQTINCVPLPKGTIKKLIGRKITWKDEPIELK